MASDDKKMVVGGEDFSDKIFNDVATIGVYSSDYASQNLYIEQVSDILANDYGIDFFYVDVESKDGRKIANHFKIKEIPSIVTFSYGNPMSCVSGLKTDVQFRFHFEKQAGGRKIVDLKELPKVKSVYAENYLKDPVNASDDQKLYNKLLRENKKDYSRAVMIVGSGFVTAIASSNPLLFALGAVTSCVGSLAMVSPVVRKSARVMEKIADNFKYFHHSSEDVSAEARKTFGRLTKGYYKGDISQANNPFSKLALKGVEIIAGAAMLYTTKGAHFGPNILVLGMAASVIFDVDEVLKDAKERILKKLEDRKFQKEVKKTKVKILNYSGFENNSKRKAGLLKKIHSIFNSEVGCSKKYQRPKKDVDIENINKKDKDFKL